MSAFAAAAAVEESPELSPGELCRQCASEGYTCCQPEYGVTITFHDARRLMEATGLALEDFARIRRIKDKELLSGLRVDPVFRKAFLGKDRLLQTVQGRVMKGKAQSKHDCFFLGKEGCRVFEDRPRLCHLHPFWFEFQKPPRAQREAEKALPKGERLEAKLRRDLGFFFDAIDDQEDAEEADCLVVQRTWPKLPRGLRSIGEDEGTLGLHARAIAREIHWQHRQVKKLLETKKAHKLKLADLAPIVAGAPLEEGFPV